MDRSPECLLVLMYVCVMMDQTADGLKEQGTDDGYSNDRMAITGKELEDEQCQHHIDP